MTITRNVRDIDAVDRRALEHVLGGELAENQQIVISVQSPPAMAHASAPHSPDVIARVMQITRELFGSEVNAAEDCNPDSPGEKYVVFRVEVADPQSAVRLEREWLSKVRCFSSQSTNFRLSLSVNV